LDTRLAPGKVRYVNLTGGQTVTTALLAGKVDAVATHPSGLESLYLQGIIRDIGTAVPGGKFVHSDRIVYYCKRSWARDNPDLIKAFLVVQNRALVFIHEHTEEAAAIVSKALRKPEEIVLAEFREPGNQRLFLPEKEYSNAVAAFETFQTLALANADGLVTESRKGFSDQQVHELFDSRFFKGGAYYPGDYDSGRLVSVTTASGVGQSLAQASSGFVK
jgi:ABC-type nitrate/sulfonate/bicarbonate transport system substrate-binding protein